MRVLILVVLGATVVAIVAGSLVSGMTAWPTGLSPGWTHMLAYTVLAALMTLAFRSRRGGGTACIRADGVDRNRGGVFADAGAGSGVQPVRFGDECGWGGSGGCGWAGVGAIGACFAGETLGEGDGCWLLVIRCWLETTVYGWTVQEGGAFACRRALCRPIAIGSGRGGPPTAGVVGFSVRGRSVGRFRFPGI